MKSIKRVVLKEATNLSTEEMKLVFGGSSAGSGSGMTSCSADCGTQSSVSFVDCKGTCTAYDGSAVVCSGPRHIMTKYCNGTSSVV